MLIWIINLESELFPLEVLYLLRRQKKIKIVAKIGIIQISKQGAFVLKIYKSRRPMHLERLLSLSCFQSDIIYGTFQKDILEMMAPYGFSFLGIPLFSKKGPAVQSFMPLPAPIYPKKLKNHPPTCTNNPPRHRMHFNITNLESGVSFPFFLRLRFI